MIDEFRSSTLVQAARKLGVNPFELVRLSVALDEPSADLRFTADSVERLREKAGIESLWQSNSLPSASNPIEAAVRGAMQLLLDKNMVGTNTMRLDNLSRGLTTPQQEAIDEATALLAEGGSVLLMSAPAGLQVSIAPGREGAVRSLADGSQVPPAVRALWTE